MNLKRILPIAFLAALSAWPAFFAARERVSGACAAEVPAQKKIVEDKLAGLKWRFNVLHDYRERHSFFRTTVNVEAGDIREIADFFEKQSESGNLYASMALAGLLLYGDYDDDPYSLSEGLGIAFDLEKCKELLRGAAQSGDAQLADGAKFLLAAFKLGITRKPMFGGNLSDSEALIDARGGAEIGEGMLELVKSAKAGNLKAAEFLREIYGGVRDKHGNFLRFPDEKLEFYWLMRAAELGANPKNSLEAGRRYFLGDGVRKNTAKAAQYFKLGAGDFERLDPGGEYGPLIIESVLCAEALAYMCDKNMLESSDADFSKKVRRKIERLNEIILYRGIVGIYSGEIFSDSEMSEYWSEKIQSNIYDRGLTDFESTSLGSYTVYDDKYYTPDADDVRAADSGDAKKQLEVGMKLSHLYEWKLYNKKYRDHDEIRDLQSRAVKYLEGAAQAGFFEAQMRLCSNEYWDFSVEGYRYRKNDLRRLYWAEIVAKSGKGEAVWQLLECYRRGFKEGKTEADGIRLLEEAAERGDYAARWILRSEYRGLADGESERKYFYWLNRQCEIFCPPGDRFALGCLYFNGIGTPEDKAKGLELIRDSASGLNNPSARAMYFLRHIYRNGVYVEADEKVSEYWLEKFKKRAHSGDIESILRGLDDGKRPPRRGDGTVFPIDKAAAAELNLILEDIRNKERLMRRGRP